MTFVVRKKIDLSFLGDGWKDAYITFTPFTFNDNAALLKLRGLISGTGTDAEGAESASKEIMDLLQEKFIEGMGFNGKELEPITKKNLGELPMEIIGKILTALQGASSLPPNG